MKMDFSGIIIALLLFAFSIFSLIRHAKLQSKRTLPKPRKRVKRILNKPDKRSWCLVVFNDESKRTPDLNMLDRQGS